MNLQQDEGKWCAQTLAQRQVSVEQKCFDINLSYVTVKKQGQETKQHKSRNIKTDPMLLSSLYTCFLEAIREDEDMR